MSPGDERAPQAGLGAPSQPAHWLLAFPGPPGPWDRLLAAWAGPRVVELPSTEPKAAAQALPATDPGGPLALSLYARDLAGSLTALLSFLHRVVPARPELRLRLLVRAGDLPFAAARHVSQALVAAGVAELACLLESPLDERSPGTTEGLARLARVPVISLRVVHEVFELSARPARNARAILARWIGETWGEAPAPVGVSAETVLLPTGSSGNLAFASCAAGRPLFVKLRARCEDPQPGRRDGAWEAASAEALVLETLADLPGFPRVAKTSAGESLARFHVDELGADAVGPVPVALATSLVPLRAFTWTAALANSVGQRVAEVHARLQPLTGRLPGRPSGLGFWMELAARVGAGEPLRARCSASALLSPFASEEAFFAAALEGAQPAAARPRCLCHGDLGQGNLWLDEGGAPVFVDFSDSKLDPPESDLARALLWCGILAGPLREAVEVEAHIRQLAEGYARGSTGLQVAPDIIRRLLVLAYAFDLLSSAAYVNPDDVPEQRMVFSPFLRALPLMRSLAGVLD